MAAPLFAAALPVLALVWQVQAGLAVLYLALWLYLPGRALARALGRKKGSLTFHLYAFYLGAAAFFVLFYLCRYFGFVWPLQVAPPLVGLVCEGLWLWRKRKTPEGKRLDDGSIPGWNHFLARCRKNLPLLWLIAAGVWVSFAFTVLMFPGPAQVSNPDYLWHMGNIHTLARSPGFEDLRVAGMAFRYHYFSDLVWAGGVLAVGLQPFYCVLRYPAIIAPALMALAVWHWMGLATRRRWLQAVGTATALFAAPLYGAYNDVTYQWASNVNAVGLALPCGLLLLAACGETLGFVQGGPAGNNKPTVSPADVLVIFLLAALTAGFKGPFGVCALAAVGGAVLARLLGGKKRPGRAPLPRRWPLVVLAALAGFALIWALLLRSGLNEGYIKSWQPAYSVYTAQVLAPLLVALGNGLAARLLLLPLHLIIILGVFSVPFVAACVRFVVRFIRKRQLHAPMLLPLAGAVAALLVFYMLDLSGRSQFYFLYFAVPLAGAVALREVDAHWLPALKVRRPLGLLVGASACCLLAFGAMHPMYEKGFAAYTAAEVEAAYWLRDNVPPGQCVATNRHGTFYLASAFSGAQFWLEGDAYAKNSGQTVEMLAGQREAGDSLFRAGTADKPAQARRLGVSYLVQYSQGVEEGLNAPPGNGFVLCWQSEGVSIWRLEE